MKLVEPVSNNLKRAEGDMGSIMSTTDLAEKLGIKRGVVNWYIREGRIKAKLVGRQYIIDSDDAVEFLKKEVQERREELELWESVLNDLSLN